MARPARKQQKIERVRADICDAAARAFARSGYDGATMADIAAEAGFAAPTLYSYFGGKKDIYDALLASMKGHIFSFFDEPVPSSLTLMQHLEFIMQRQRQWLDENFERLQCLMVERFDNEIRTEVHQEFLAKLIALLDQYPDDPCLQGVSSREAAFIFWAMANASHERKFKLGLDEIITQEQILVAFQGACMALSEAAMAEG